MTQKKPMLIYTRDAVEAIQKLVEERRKKKRKILTLTKNRAKKTANK